MKITSPCGLCTVDSRSLRCRAQRWRRTHCTSRCRVLTAAPLALGIAGAIHFSSQNTDSVDVPQVQLPEHTTGAWPGRFQWSDQVQIVANFRPCPFFRSVLALIHGQPILSDDAPTLKCAGISTAGIMGARSAATSSLGKMQHWLAHSPTHGVAAGTTGVPLVSLIAMGPLPVFATLVGVSVAAAADNLATRGLSNAPMPVPLAVLSPNPRHRQPHAALPMSSMDIVRAALSGASLSATSAAAAGMLARSRHRQLAW